MKRIWAGLLAALLAMAVFMAGASAEANEEIEVVVDFDEIDAPVEPEDAVILEDAGVWFDDTELPGTDEIDGITLDSLEVAAAAKTAPAGNAVANDSAPEDFEIINGILVKYKGPGGDVIIPDGVTAIGKEAFYYRASLTGITIPDGVTSIGYRAFCDCTGLTTVTIGNGVTSIGSEAFYGCTGLISITIPDSVTSIGGGAFDGCSGLTGVNIPDSVTSIGGAAFSGCTGLTGITIPDGVTSIGGEAFYGCTRLTTVTIGNGVTSIGDSAFSGCTGLTVVTIPDSVTSIDDYAFSDCSGLTDVTIGNGVTSIGYRAFKGCTGLTTVTIGNSVKNIDNEAFSGCTGLTGVNIPDSVTSIGGYAFYRCAGLTGVTIGSGVSYIMSGTFGDCTHLASIVIPAGVETIGRNAFENCYRLMDITVENGSISISDSAFSNCPAAMTFRTPCESPATKWAEGKGYTVVKSDHTSVTDPAVPATCTQTGLTEGSHCSACGKVIVKQKTVPKLISIKNCSVTGIKDAVYAGKAIVPAPVVKYNGKKLKKGTDYTVKYTGNKAVGTATVKITGIGKYGESVSKTFKINPKPVALSAVTPGSGQLTVKWKKGAGITGYEVQYSLKKSFASAKKVTVAKAATVKAVLKKLQPRKTYYVRVRTYKTVKGKKYYSAWSGAKSAVTRI